MVDTNIEISIVIVTWNAKKYMRDCLKSLEDQDTGVPTEIIVVDNASTDGTADLIRSEFPNVKLVENEKNLGFARGNNVGLRRSSGKYVFLINPDVIVLPGCLKSLIAQLDQDTSIGLVGPRMLDADRIVRRSTMRFPTPWNTFCRSFALHAIFRGSKTFGGYLMSDFKNDRTLDVDILNGWFWATTREALNRVGGLDEQLFMYGDDLDWSYRFYQAGYRRVYCADAAAVHYGGGTTAKSPVYFYIERQRADLQFWIKYHGRLAVTFYILMVLLNEWIRVIGHSIVFVFRKSARSDAAYKVKRSWACIWWLLGVRPNKPAIA
jgi:GT2 family glycosyltransferase